MADADEKKEERKEKSTEKDAKEKKSLIGSLLPWIIMVVVVGLCAGAGIGLGRIIAGTDESNVDGSDQAQNEAEEDVVDIDELSGGSGKLWYYDLEPPVVANLNEPGITRYISASLTLQMSSADEKKVTTFLDEKTPILRNWLYIYLSGLSVDNIQGDKNLKSIQSQICDGFNKELFPNSKPQIKQILIREFPVQ